MDNSTTRMEILMEATALGVNRTGAATSATGTGEMQKASSELTPPTPVENVPISAERLRYIEEADRVGSVPPPPTFKGVVKAGLSKVTGHDPGLFFDKLGERLAFERTGTRLYEALLTKYEAVSRATPDILASASDAISSHSDGDLVGNVDGESPGLTLARIRMEELEHFRMLSRAVQRLGGDPTAQTPCADVVGVASIGFMQVLTDPRTTLAQCLNTMLTVELSDNAGWELLAELADAAGEKELVGMFLGALAQEQEHLAIIKAWLRQLTATASNTAAV
jgi:rubrerythrin